MGTSNTQVDLLGNRLKLEAHSESDLRLLDEYRRSFGDAYQSVIHTLREKEYEPTGRLAKSTRSIVEKLRRESIRLSQMQDIAGCRIVVPNTGYQDRCVADLRGAYGNAHVMDRREKPMHGYRAIHIIAAISGRPVEIQVRTSLQHEWAELSEKSSDVLDPQIKYGGGHADWLSRLMTMSRFISEYEAFEKPISEGALAVAAIEKQMTEFPEDVLAHNEAQMLREELKELKLNIEESSTSLNDMWNSLAALLKKMALRLDEYKRRTQ